MTPENAITSYYFRSFAADHNERVGPVLTWSEARQLWAQARADAGAYITESKRIVALATKEYPR